MRIERLDHGDVAFGLYTGQISSPVGLIALISIDVWCELKW